MGKKKEEPKQEKRTQRIIPVNRRAKDSLFKTVYADEARQRELTSALLGVSVDTVRTANIRPVVFGDKENDFACMCDELVYFMMETQSTAPTNIPFRMGEYLLSGLRSLTDSTKMMYGSKREMLPLPKLYLLQTGLAESASRLPEKVRSRMRLGDSFQSTKCLYGKDIRPDIALTVHVYDFRMSLGEILAYIEGGKMPVRFRRHGKGGMRDYALVANGITYIQRAEREAEAQGRDKPDGMETDPTAKYRQPENVRTVAEFLELMASRGIFVDLLRDKEVCNMTMAEFSRDEMIRYQGLEEGLEKGREEGREEGLRAFILDKVEDGIPESIIVQKLRKRFSLDEPTARQSYERYAKA